MASNVLGGPVILVILDGFGYSKSHEFNAIYAANKPNIDKWLKTYPNTLLNASGKYVGLFEGFIGNSEVGHCTIGCGRVIKQPLVVISQAIADGSFFTNKVLLESLKKIKNSANNLDASDSNLDESKNRVQLGEHNLCENGGDLHIMGLLSDAGVHSHIEHLYAFLMAAKGANIKNVYVHAFLDGRDVGPKTAGKYLKDLDNFMKNNEIGVLASLHGRFYAMDRDKNWDRIDKSCKVLLGQCDSVGKFCESNLCHKDSLVNSGQENITGAKWEDIINNSYAQDITDEFVVPVNICPQGVIKNGDGVIFFNFRPDRARQITKCFVDQNFNIFHQEKYGAKTLEVKKINLACFVTPVQYDKNLKTDFMFEQAKVLNTLKDVLAANGKTIFSIAETEKYAHVTYFFDGDFSSSLKKRDIDTQVIIKSKTLESYSSYPQMSADKITQAVVDSLNNDPKDFYLINYANADMVGHSGNFDATVKAVECLDIELKKLYDIVIKKLGGTMYITADHGKAESMFDECKGQPNTAHTANQVPFIFIKSDLENSDLSLGLTELADIAPFILQNMGIIAPKEMEK